AADTVAPLLSSTTPADDAANVLVAANLVLSFNESVKAGIGNIVIRRASDASAVATIAITDASQVSISGAAVTINPTNDLQAGTHYYVTVDAGAIQDLAGNPYAGISSNTAFDFTTVAAGSGPRVAYDFDGDSKSDLLLQSDTGQNTVWLMNGAQ